MKNINYSSKHQIETLVNSNKIPFTVSYNPNKITAGIPESNAISLGLTEYYRETYPDLVEIIYMKDIAINSSISWDNGSALWDNGTTTWLN